MDTEVPEIQSTASPELPRGYSASCRLLCLFTLILIGSTWRLWLPQQVYPQVPLFEWLTSVPLWVDGLMLAILVASLGLAAAARGGSRLGAAALLSACATFLLLSILDQHRLQPWAYFFMLAGVVAAFCRPALAMRWLRWLIVSVYAYSAASKFDYLFASTIGQEFLNAGFGLVGVSIELWPAAVRHGLALLMPVGELLVALLLLIPRSRRLGVLAGIGLHTLLLAILSPWGMNQKIAVLIWNLSFCFLLVALFWWRPPDFDGRAKLTGPLDWLMSLLARAIVFLALLMPCLEPFGLWDHWLAWGLYSTRAARIDFFVAEPLMAKLPPELQAHCSEHLYAGYLHKLSIDRWSLAALGVPVYPQDRYKSGVCLAIVERYGLDQGAVVVHLSSADRFTGRSKRQTWSGRDEIRKGAARFRLNAMPRDGFVGPLDEPDARRFDR